MTANPIVAAESPPPVDDNGISDGMQAIALLTRIALATEESNDRFFSSPRKVEALAEKAKEARDLIVSYAAALTTAGFPEIAEQVMKVLA